ncbi:rhodanese-like domain-containing protein [Blautia sp. HCP3S3_G3]|uniref:rhodanese-like domain-containing protein n=1 Tax=Blautia sp. HCP3S3_G3 TaxID=3438913 RepID=UPI003F8BB764
MFQLETISAKMLDYYVGRSDALIIDLRERETYEKGHVRTAVSVPYGELEERKDFPVTKILVFYCDRGGASMMAARQFARKGYRTRSVIGGFEAYRGRNLVISREP